MSPTSSSPSDQVRRVRFAVFEVDLTSGELTRRGARIRIHDKPFQILAALIERPGELVTREELRSRLWSDETFVDFDNNLNGAVRKLRQALGDSAESPRFVETLPKRGYRFIARVEPVEPEPGVDEAPPPASSRRGAGIGLAVVAVTVAALAAGLLMGWGDRKPAQPAGPDRAMLVVLPFENLDGDPARDFFCDGLTEEMIMQLGRLQPERLGVIARTSSMQYKAVDKNVDQIGLELGVDYLLEGSVRWAGTTARITAQLIQVSDQTHLWAETYDVEMDDLLAVQGEVAVQVARYLALELLPDQPIARARSGTRVTEAYELFLRGRYAWHKFNDDGYRSAVALFKQALELDPDFVEAWAGLADAYNLQSFMAGVTPSEVFPLAREAAMKALALDDTCAEAHNALAFVLLYYDYDLEGADEEFRRALELRPNYAMAYHWRAGALSAMERHDEAIAAMRHAVELDPVALSVLSDAGWYYVFADRNEEAIDECQRTLEMSDYGWARACLFEATLQSGRYDEAFKMVRSSYGDLDGVPASIAAVVDGGDPVAAIGALQKIRLEQVAADEESNRRFPMQLVHSAAVAGEVDVAFEALERAYELRDAWVVFLRVDPRFDPLQADPRFDELARRVGL